MSTPGQQADFVRQWWGPAQSVGRAAGWHPELVLATWSLDTGWGDARGMMACHALLGIVCYDPGRYPCTLFNATLCFYCYPTWEDFIATFTEVIQQRHYDVVRQAGGLLAQTQALALQTGFAGGSTSYLPSLLAVEGINEVILQTGEVPPGQVIIGGGTYIGGYPQGQAAQQSGILVALGAGILTAGAVGLYRVYRGL